MKKKVYIGVGIATIIFIFVGIITNYADSGRATTGQEPKYCLKIVSKDGSKITYWGLGYKVIRYVEAFPTESYENNIGVKMGSWFMKYDLPSKKNITIEYDDKTIEIRKYNDTNIIYNILVNSKYNSELCDGINTHKITIDNEIYYLKESCQEIKKGDKQAKISEEDLNMILKIIENNQ